MSKNNFLFALGGIILGLTVGFLSANSLNRSEIAQNNPAPAVSPQSPQVQNALVKDQPSNGGAMLPDIEAVINKASSEPNNFGAQVKAGDMYQQIKGFEKAVAFYEQAHKLQPSDYDLIVKIGNTYFDARQFESAAKWYEQALAKKADDVNVRTDLGITFVERAQPDYDRAIKEFQTSLKTDPKHEPTLYNLGVAYFKQGNKEDAAKILTQLETINPSSSLVGRLRQAIS